MIGGCDPSNKHIGLAVLDAPGGGAPTKPPGLWLDVVRVHVNPLETDKRLRGSLLLRQDDWGPPYVTHWAIERPPDKARRDANHGPQAPIGYGTGRWGGWVGALVAPDATCITNPTPSEWRARMLVWSARWGVPLPTAKKSLQGRVLRSSRRAAVENKVERCTEGFRVRFAGCSHAWTAATFSALVAEKPDTCPTCAEGHTGTLPNRAEAIRDAWKAIACRFVAAHWPQEYAQLVEPIRARARTDRPDHKLEGVSDACEAVGIATSLLE